MSKNDDALLNKVLEVVRGGSSRRSPLFYWMQDNRAALAKAFAERSPDWAALAATFGTDGIMDRDGKPPSAATARQTWYRVQRSAGAPGRKAKEPEVAEAVKRGGFAVMGGGGTK